MDLGERRQQKCRFNIIVNSVCQYNLALKKNVFIKPFQYTHRQFRIHRHIFIFTFEDVFGTQRTTLPQTITSSLFCHQRSPVLCRILLRDHRQEFAYYHVHCVFLVFSSDVEPRRYSLASLLTYFLVPISISSVLFVCDNMRLHI